MANSRLGLDQNLPTGASYDLFLIEFPDGFPTGQMLFNIEDTPRKITGIQKVAQLFLKVLLTRKGSDVLNPKLGTLLPEYIIHANRTGTNSTLYNNILKEVRNATSYVQRITKDNDAASTIANIEVIGLDVVDDCVSMSLALTTGDGAYATISVPFPQTDLNLAS